MFKLKHYPILFLLILLFIIPWNSSLQCSENIDFNNVEEVVDFALERAPDIIRSNAYAEQTTKEQLVAKQRPNPEFSTTHAFNNKLLDYKAFDMTVSLIHTVETGGKRDARIEMANKEYDHAKTLILRAKEQTKIHVLYILNRLRQLKTELATIEEAIDVFEKIRNQYLAKPYLSPEQKISASVFDIAKSDYFLRKNALEIDRNNINQQLFALLGLQIKIKDSLLPEVHREWPEISEDMVEDVFRGSAILTPKAELKISEAELDLAKSESWPNLRIGPYYQLENQTQNSHAFGFSITFNLPLFHANGGGRAHALAGIHRSEKNLNVTYRELKAERNNLVVQYKKAIEFLNKGPSLKEILSKHQNIEGLFQRGVISSNLVIEAHRQIVDLTKNKNENELLALMALWKIQTLDGNFIKEKI